MNLRLQLRLPEQEEAYQAYKNITAAENMLQNWQDRIVKEFAFWVIIENKFPWNKVAKQHHLLIPKRRFARAEDMNTQEEIEWKMIRKEINKKYDMFIENFTGTVSDLYHPHLIVTKDIY